MTRLPSPEFWRGRRVLLTGHTGFKGAWTALWLLEMGAQVTGFALEPDSDPALFEMAKVDAGVTSIIADLRDRDAVSMAVKAAAPELVLHMAAQPIVRRAIAEPVETVATNVLGTAHLLDALREAPDLRTILVVTSDKVYANSETGEAFAENDRLGGEDPYSASKAAAEMVAHAFARTYFTARGTRLATARGGNVIGGGDFAADRIVPDIWRSLVSGETLVLRMLEATRPWQHVLDCIAGYLVYAEALDTGEDVPPALNFGPVPGIHATVAELAGAIFAAFGQPALWRHEPVPGSVEKRHLAVDSALARKALGWGDRLGGENLVKWTADWYLQVHNGRDARQMTLDQLHAYANL